MSNVGFNKSGKRFTIKECVIAKAQRGRDKQKLYSITQMAKREFNSMYSSTCQLWLGDSMFPKTSVMTMREMYKENLQLEYSFRKRLDKESNIKPRLMLWKLSECKEFSSLKFRYITLRREGFKINNAMKLINN